MVACPVARTAVAAGQSGPSGQSSALVQLPAAVGSGKGPGSAFTPAPMEAASGPWLEAAVREHP